MMASIANDPGGRKRVIFVDKTGRRRALWLGKASKRAAEAVKLHVSRLVSASITCHAVEDDTARWVAGLDTVMLGKLSGVGLIPKRASATLAAFVDGYIAERQDVKTNTTIFYRHPRRCLVEYFGADKPLREIAPGDADAWRQWLVNEKLADNTVRRRTGVARQFFKVAVRRGLVASNPFDGLAASIRPNTKRFFYVTRKMADAVLSACPDAQWRLIFALTRYGGLRCPSELLALKWSDVTFAQDRASSGGRIPDRTPVRGGGIPFPGRVQRAEQKRIRHHPVSRDKPEPTHAACTDHPPGGAGPVAQALPEPAEYPGNGTGRILPHARGLRLDR